jgi:hypothetical protein
MNPGFRAHDAPTLDTIRRAWLVRSRRFMRDALHYARHQYPLDAWRAYGEASAAVSVLYDTNHPRAYGALVALKRTARALQRTIPSGLTEPGAFPEG